MNYKIDIIKRNCDTYKQGDVVVWLGREKCIYRIKCRHDFGNDESYASYDPDADSMSARNLRRATYEEILLLGIKSSHKLYG